ncbi:MAG: sugar ABC transporter permease [Clostridiaceae bacterium]|nr:sugar ABC transporter permease [Clostridiaceae bacterium]
MRSLSFSEMFKINKINQGYLFIAPAIILIALMTIYPTYKLFDLSFHKLNRRTQETTFVGINNFKDVISDPNFETALKQTMVFTGFGVLGHMGLGLLLALLLNSNINNTVLSISRSLILLPWVVSPPVVAILTQLWGHPLISPIGKILSGLGWQGTFMPLGSVNFALPSIIIINIWQFTPFYMLMILVNLQTIDKELYSAAMVDGANYLQKIRFITLPHIKNVLLTFTLYSIVVNASYFDLIWIATQGGPIRVTEVLATYTYRLAFQSLNWNKASVVGIILLIFSLLLSFITFFLMRNKENKG